VSQVTHNAQLAWQIHGWRAISNGLQLIVVDLAGHGAHHQFAVEPVAWQLGKLIDKLAQIGAALERHASHIGANQWADGSHQRYRDRPIARDACMDNGFFEKNQPV